ncbi:MAG: tRNA 2-thiouridine(34) synthase MnmA [Selenomonadaceae bacterium]|nr:tRNA 2-thiouridine(34) synthase MnmA [Selenomonadaceae bacterium]
MKKKVAVAMSGGVDSSLTAALLLERGFEVFGVTMLLSIGNYGEKPLTPNSYLLTPNCISDAQKVCNYLGINHHVADFREIFRAEIENYFVEEYLRGRTPNPCVRCNKKIKFGKLFDLAKNLGADFFATGHYARIIFEDGRFKLKKAVDLKKDQSYVLYNLTAEKLAKIILPLGEFSKVETRALAEKLNLPVADKPDSQEICFVPNDDYKNFIATREPSAQALKDGEIIDSSGKVLGNHHGVANYTIGQRKGLGIAAPQPLYVTRLDVENKKVIVDTNDKLFSTTLTACDAHWIYKPPLPKTLTAKIRYGSKFSECTVAEEKNFLRVIFSEPQRAITPGQSIVFYDRDEVLGGAIITEENFCK